MTPNVIDISHYQTNVDFNKIKAAGIVGVIHKATEGTGYRDKRYPERKKLAKAAGLLWGAYHFGNAADPKAQVKNFLEYADLDAGDLAALDYEDNTKSQMTLAQAKEFMVLAEQQLGRDLVVYSGNTIKQALGKKIDAFWGSKRLWHAQYGKKYVVQASWKKPWLWQYSATGKVNGVSGDVDVNVYVGDGTLPAEWSGAKGGDPVSPVVVPAGKKRESILVTLVKGFINVLKALFGK